MSEDSLHEVALIRSELLRKRQVRELQNTIVALTDIFRSMGDDLTLIQSESNEPHIKRLAYDAIEKSMKPLAVLVGRKDNES